MILFELFSLYMFTRMLVDNKTYLKQD